MDVDLHQAYDRRGQPISQLRYTGRRDFLAV